MIIDSFDTFVSRLISDKTFTHYGLNKTFKVRKVDVDKNILLVFDPQTFQEREFPLKGIYENHLFKDIELCKLKDEGACAKCFHKNNCSGAKVSIKDRALEILRLAYGINSSFRKGQLEAIMATFTHQRTLIVQKTGWGKSLIYFICTKINRELGKGLTLVISPLTALIENQIASAKKFSLNCERISHENRDKHVEIIEKCKTDNLDILFITPESLFSKLNEYISELKIGMFVIDEVHCISDWGHDFRLTYRKIVDVLKKLRDTNFPIVATTATADDRVINDLESQIGPNLFISRGSLFRDNLYIKTIDLGNKLNKYAWILNHISDFQGTGIIYCLTTRDCESLSKFLSANNISAKPYHAKLSQVEMSENLNLFVNNQIKVLVATIKLGMGYDKPDISFVIHYQFPKNIVSYYQQIGRAARNIGKGYAILLKGGNDEKILQYYIDNSFPSELIMEKVLKEFLNLHWGKNFLTIDTLCKRINIPEGKIELALKFLEFENYITREGNKYIRTANPFKYNGEHYDLIKKIKSTEAFALKEMFSTKKCLNQFILDKLGEKLNCNCNNCSNCTNDNLFLGIDEKAIKNAKSFVENDVISFNLDHRYSVYRKYDSISKKWIKINQIKDDGFALSRYGEEGIGEMIAKCKYSKPPLEYPDAIYVKAVRLLIPYIKKYSINTITFCPSLNNNLMNIFAKKLGNKLGLNVINCFVKKENIQQKTMQNFKWQTNNATNNYSLINSVDVSGLNILLIDDIIDSGYTLCALGKFLMKAGANNIFPFALSDSGTRRNDNDDNN